MKKKIIAGDVNSPTPEEVQEAMQSMQDSPPASSVTIETEVIKDAMKEEEKKQDAAKPSNTVLVGISEGGAFEFRNQTELSASAKFAIAAKIAPEHLRKEGPEAVAAALVFCKQHNLPLSAMGKMAYIRGKVQVFGTLYMALAQRHKDFGEMRIFFVDKDHKEICFANKNLDSDVWACVISARKKKDTLWSEFFFTRKEAETAGLFKNAVYKSYLKDMLYHRTKQRMVDAFYASAVEGIEYYEANIEYDAEKEVGQSLNEKLGLTEKESA